MALCRQQAEVVPSQENGHVSIVGQSQARNERLKLAGGQLNDHKWLSCRCNLRKIGLTWFAKADWRRIFIWCTRENVLERGRVCSRWTSQRPSPCKIWSFHGGHYEEFPIRNAQETHYVSTTELSGLMPCKIWGFHGGDYEEFRLLGNKNPGHIWLESHYVSAAEPSRLVLCKILGFTAVTMKNSVFCDVMLCDL
jgi:hypothetical protein